MNNSNYEDVCQNVLRGDKYSGYVIKESIVGEPLWDNTKFEKVSGNTVLGELVDIQRKKGDYGWYSIYYIDSDRLDKKHDKVYGCKSLDEKMQFVTIGDVVEIRYNGCDENGKHDYSVNLCSYC